MLRHENTRLSAQIASLEKQLKEFKSSEPDRGGSAPQPANGQPKGFDRIRQGLAKIAK
jgi:cell division septum initiation protein DivIVA